MQRVKDLYDTILQYRSEIGTAICVPLGVSLVMMAFIFVLGLFSRYCMWVGAFLGTW
jgi:hypothetical protein